MTDKTETQEVAQQGAPATEAQQSVDLNVQDLNMLRSIIDLAAQRGAFKPAEMAAVGAVYNKLNGFLEGVAKQGQQQNG
jgi:hypothetical protein